MTRFGLIGPSYADQSLTADAQATINFYPEAMESGAGNAPIILLPTPGLATFATPGNTPGVSSFDMGGHASSNSARSISVGPLSPSTAVDFAIFASAPGFGLTSGPAGWTEVATEDLNSQFFAFYNANITGAVTPTLTYNTTEAPAAAAALFLSNGAAVIVNRYTSPANANLVTGTNTVTLNPTTEGNSLIVVCGSYFAANTFSNFADGGGDTFTQLETASSNTGGVQIFGAFNIAGGTTSLTFTLAGNDTAVGRYWVAEIGSDIPPAKSVRGLFTITGRTFAVVGSRFIEVTSAGDTIDWGPVGNDALPVTMAASPQQLLLASAGTAFVFDLGTNTLTEIPGATFSGPVSIVGICDDFFLAVIKDSKEFYVSAPLDANDWTTNGSAIVSVFPDNIVGMLVDHREIWFWSDTQSVVYYDSGNVFPFDVVPGGFIEAGLAAKSTPAQLDNTVFWLGADARGTCVVWRGYGYTPQRVSNHALEFAMQGYSRVDDAVAFSYQDQGHQFYVLYFPTPSKTWVYDTLTQMWHERGFWLESIGQFRAAHYWNHTFNFGKHLAGDWQSPTIYEMHIPVPNGSGWDFADDAGNPIRRVRRSPHISREQKYQFFAELQVLIDAGLGPIPPLTDGSGNARGPEMTLRWSLDSGRTWSNEYTRDGGQAGNYLKRMRWLRLGRARDMILEISCTDPIGWRVVDGYLEIIPGTGV